jgi:hypothetical protein
MQDRTVNVGKVRSAGCRTSIEAAVNDPFAHTAGNYDERSVE